MSGSARPAWNHAAGTAREPTFQTSVRDQPSHGTLKVRARAVDATKDELSARILGSSAKDDDESSLYSNNSEDDSEDSNDSGDLDESCDDIALERELETVRGERLDAAEAAQLEHQQRILASNPLLSKGGSESSSSWNDNTVFGRRDDTLSTSSHTAVSTDSTKGKRFINDSQRSDKHRAFMDKYIQ